MELKSAYYFKLLLMVSVIVLLGGGNKSKNDTPSMVFGSSVTYKNGIYWIMGGISNKSLSIITIRSVHDLPDPNGPGFTYSYSTVDKNIILQTPSFPTILIKPGYGGLFYFNGKNIEFYKKEFDQVFLVDFFKKLNCDQEDKEFDISKFCRSIGINEPPVQLDKIFILQPLSDIYSGLVPPDLLKKDVLTNK